MSETSAVTEEQRWTIIYNNEQFTKSSSQEHEIISMSNNWIPHDALEAGDRITSQCDTSQFRRRVHQVLRGHLVIERINRQSISN